MNKIKSIILISIIFSTSILAGIYKWVDDNGVTHYSEAKPINIKTEKLEIESYSEVSVESLPKSYEFKPIERNAKLTRPKTKQVVMYSAEWCGVCKSAKKHFKKKGIRYTLLNIDKSKSARARYNKLGATGVPVILVGKQRMNGFSASKFDRMYNSKP